MKTIVLLFIYLSLGGLYYVFATSRDKTTQRFALIFKISLLVISFILEFIRQDFIVIGQFAIGDHSTVLMLILFEIADALIAHKSSK